MRARVCIGLVAGCLLAALVAPGGASGAVALQPVGTFASPIYVTSPPGDSRLFVVERGGTIEVLHDGTTSQFLDIHTLVDSEPTMTERGLLSMAFDPNYAANGLFYVFFNDNGTAGAADGDIHVDEFRVTANPNVADAGSRRRVLTLVRGTSAGNHNGGQLQFGKDGDLYISVGDAANGSNAQTLANPHGKILRIDPHGATDGAHGTAGNPFVGVAGAAPEIWSLGLRNPFRFSFDHVTGDMLIGDVGLSTREEVDFAPQSAGLGRGANYGWPNCEGFLGSCAGFTAPVFTYPHANPGDGGAYGTAIIGGYVYRGTQVPELAGRYVYADLSTAVLRSQQLGQPLSSGDRSEGVSIPGATISFGEDSACNLYVADGADGVSKIVSTAPPAVAPACATSAAPIAKKKCKKRKHKKKRHSATTAKKHKKHHKKKCKRKKHKKKHKR